MDLIYIHKAEGLSEELKYSLRSVESNLIYSDGEPICPRVFIAGDIPDWMNPDSVIKVTLKEYDWLDPGNRYMNAEARLLSFCELDFIKDRAMFFHDDFFVMRPPSLQDLLHAHRGPIRRSNTKDTYWHTISRTHGLLRELGVSQPLNYEIHRPMVIHPKERFFVSYMLRHRMKRGEVFQMRSVYANIMELEGKKMEDTKNIKPEKQTYLSTDNHSFYYPIHIGDDLISIGDIIRDRFPNKSKYEK